MSVNGRMIEATRKLMRIPNGELVRVKDGYLHAGANGHIENVVKGSGETRRYSVSLLFGGYTTYPEDALDRLVPESLVSAASDSVQSSSGSSVELSTVRFDLTSIDARLATAEANLDTLTKKDVRPLIGQIREEIQAIVTKLPA